MKFCIILSNASHPLPDFLRQARYDRDHLERNYTRILNGLQEHEAMILPASPSKKFVAVPSVPIRPHSNLILAAPYLLHLAASFISCCVGLRILPCLSCLDFLSPGPLFKGADGASIAAAFRGITSVQTWGRGQSLSAAVEWSIFIASMNGDFFDLFLCPVFGILCDECQVSQAYYLLLFAYLFVY